MVEASKYLLPWRKALDEALLTSWQGKNTIEGAVIVEADFFLQKPVTTKHQLCPTGPPDLDELIRCVGDALTRARIVLTRARIVKTTQGLPPGVCRGNGQRTKNPRCSLSSPLGAPVATKIL